MYFINFKDLKIDRTYNYQTIEEDYVLEEKADIYQLDKETKALCDKMISKTALPTEYKINIYTRDLKALEDDSLFLSFVPIFVSNFFDTEVVQPVKGRPRERRLGIPPEFQNVATNIISLKKAINAVTKNDIFNITLSVKDEDDNEIFGYSLVSQEREGAKDGN